MTPKVGDLVRVASSSLVGVLVPGETTGNLTLMLVDPYGAPYPHAFFIDKTPEVFSAFWDPQGVHLTERQKIAIADLKAKHQ